MNPDITLIRYVLRVHHGQTWGQKKMDRWESQP